MTRTSTELPRLEPESSASTNSAMAALKNRTVIIERVLIFMQIKYNHNSREGHEGSEEKDGARAYSLKEKKLN